MEQRDCSVFDCCCAPNPYQTRQSIRTKFTMETAELTDALTCCWYDMEFVSVCRLDPVFLRNDRCFMVIAGVHMQSHVSLCPLEVHSFFERLPRPRVLISFFFAVIDCFMLMAGARESNIFFCLYYTSVGAFRVRVLPCKRGVHVTQSSCHGDFHHAFVWASTRLLANVSSLDSIY